MDGHATYSGLTLVFATYAQTVDATKADTVHGFYNHFPIQFVYGFV